MWKSGNMQTVRSGSSRKTPWKPRSQLARWDRTTPFGRPVLPLVKKITWGSVSRRPGSSIGALGSSRRRASSTTRSGSSAYSRPAASRPASPTGSNAQAGMPASSASFPATPARAESTIRSEGRASRATSAASSAPTRAFNGAKTAPSRASATKSGRTSIDVSAQPTTRSPWPIHNRSRRARAIRSASRSSSA